MLGGVEKRRTVVDDDELRAAGLRSVAAICQDSREHGSSIGFYVGHETPNSRYLNAQVVSSDSLFRICK